MSIDSSTVPVGSQAPDFTPFTMGGDKDHAVLDTYDAGDEQAPDPG